MELTTTSMDLEDDQANTKNIEMNENRCPRRSIIT